MIHEHVNPSWISFTAWKIDIEGPKFISLPHDMSDTHWQNLYENPPEILRLLLRSNQPFVDLERHL